MKMWILRSLLPQDSNLEFEDLHIYKSILGDYDVHSPWVAFLKKLW